MQTKSYNASTASLGSGILAIMRALGMTVITITAVLVLVGTVLGLAGCSGNKGKTADSNQSNHDSSSLSHDPVAPIAAVTNSNNPVITAKKKPPVKRSRTVAYSSSVYGVSFRFPSQYTLITSKDDQLSALAEAVPSNFVQAGGVTLATLELPQGSSTAFFSVSVNKGLNYQLCQQFAIPDPSDMAGNSPVDSRDASIPSKTSIHGVDFSKVENATEQEDIKYYHHFELASDGTSGTCYEFALGVEDSRVSSKTLDQPEQFDKLERIMATVKINPEPSAAATASRRESGSTSPQ